MSASHPLAHFFPFEWLSEQFGCDLFQEPTTGGTEEVDRRQETGKWVFLADRLVQQVRLSRRSGIIPCSRHGISLHRVVSPGYRRDVVHWISFSPSSGYQKEVSADEGKDCRHVLLTPITGWKMVSHTKTDKSKTGVVGGSSHHSFFSTRGISCFPILE